MRNLPDDGNDDYDGDNLDDGDDDGLRVGRIGASGRSSFPAGFVSYPKLQQKNEDKVEDEDDHHDENHHGDDHDDLE